MAEDHPAVVEDLRALLESAFDVVATVGDGDGLVAAADALTPDVIVSDIAMPGLAGVSRPRNRTRCHERNLVKIKPAFALAVQLACLLPFARDATFAEEAAQGGQSLDQAANDPMASLMSVQRQNLYSGSYQNRMI